MIRPRKSRGSTAGIAIVAVLISAVVFLGIIVAITGTLSLSSRQSTSDQRVTLEAQYASESGISRVMAEAQNGLLKTWTSLLLKMDSPGSLDTPELQRLAKLFCNYPVSQTLAAPNPAVADQRYCEAQAGVNTPGRFDVFASLVPISGYAAADPAITGAVPSNAAEAAAYWGDVFSDGPGGVRYPGTVSGNVSYNVGFGLEALEVRVVDGTKYRFILRARDAVSTGRFQNGATLISSRVSQRSFPEQYYIDVSPPSLSYFLSLTDAQGPTNGSTGEPVYFTKDTLLDGPIHTNGAFYFRGNPWFNGDVTSAGCVTSYTTNVAAKTSTCDTTPTTGFYNDGALGSNPSTFTVDAVTGQAAFPGYGVAAGVTESAPEFAAQNLVAKPKPAPWDYKGEFGEAIITLPKVSTPQRTLAEQSGILIEATPNPILSGFYDNPTPELYLQATTDPRSTATSFGTVSNSTAANPAKNATGQVIQMRLNQKIQRCNAPVAGITINPLADTVSVGSTSNPFTATVTGQDNYSFEYAPTIKTVTWTNTEPSTLTNGDFTGETPGSNSSAATNKYKPVAGFAVQQNSPVSTPVTITATSAYGNKTASAKLTVNPTAPAVSLSASPPTLFYGGGTSSTLNWGFGAGNGPFTQLLEQSTDNGVTWITVPGAPTTSDGTTNRSFTVTPTITTRYRLTATGPTGLTASDIAPITIAPPANPNVALSISPTGTIPFGGQTKRLTWSVSNVNATSTASGAGPGPFTYILEQRTIINGVTSAYAALTTVTAPASGGSFDYVIPANLTANDIMRHFRVRASATVNGVATSGTSPRRDANHLKPANPVVNTNYPNGIGTEPAAMRLPYGGGTVNLSWSVTNANANAAGTGPYTYQVQSSTSDPYSGYTNIGGPTTATSQTFNPTGKIWYNVIATNTTTTLTGADWEETYFRDLPLPTVDLTSSSYNVPNVNTPVTLSYSVTNGVDSKVTRGNTSGTILRTVQTGATPNGVATTGVITNVAVPGPGFTDYTVTASNLVGTVTKTIRVYINNPGGTPPPPPPIINTFTATPPTIYYPTNTSRLSWTLSGGAPTALSISNNVGPQVGNVLGSPNKDVTLNATTDYTLNASNAGGSVTLNTRVTVAPAVVPTVALNAPNPNPIGYGGGNTTLSWNVTNPSVAGAAGAGTGPYTFVVQRNTGGNTWTTVATQTAQGVSGTYTYTAPGNSGTSDVNYPFRVIAANTSTALQGTSNTQNVTVNPVAAPIATISAAPATHGATGGTSTISWGVSNNTVGVGGAGTGPYTYVVERQIPGSSTWTSFYSGTATSATPTFTGLNAGVTRYRVTATNTSTLKPSSNLPVATVTVAQPPPPTITSFTANPNPITSSSGGNTTFNWTLGGGPVNTGGLTISEGVGTVTGTSKSGVFVASTNTYTLTAVGPGGTATSNPLTVTVPLPPKTLNGLDKAGTDSFRPRNSGTIDPGWKATPTWTGAGPQPTVTANDYNVQVSASAPGGVFTATPDANGNIILNIGAHSVQTTYTVTATLTVGGVTKGPVTWKMIVTLGGAPASLRPRARLTQTTLDCSATAGPVSYDWATFVDYYIDENKNYWRREYPSQDQNAYTRPATTTAPWVPFVNKFNGVVYVDGGMSVKGPSRSNPDLPTTAAPSVAHFAALTLATDKKLTVFDDLKYEDPVCSTSPERGVETVAGANNGTVTPADCRKTGWSRNVLGLYSSGPEGIEFNTRLKDTTIQAVSLASQGEIKVPGLPAGQFDPCPDDLLPTKGLGSINIQGGLIQKRYGEFSKFGDDSNVNCGYGRTMTYDVRMKEPQYSPPGFPEAENAKPVIKLATRTNPTVFLQAGDVLPLVTGFSRISK